jgi:hypothetical protein
MTAALGRDGATCEFAPQLTQSITGDVSVLFCASSRHVLSLTHSQNMYGRVVQEWLEKPGYCALIASHKARPRELFWDSFNKLGEGVLA